MRDRNKENEYEIIVKKLMRWGTLIIESGNGILFHLYLEVNYKNKWSKIAFRFLI